MAVHGTTPDVPIRRARCVLAVLAATAACRGNGRSPDQPPVPTPPPAAPTETPAPAGSATEPATAPPPGTDKLVVVPPDIAKGVRLVEVADGLDRPVLLVAAPGDARRRLFILEQHKGTVRILENGKVAAAPFLTLSGVSTGNEQGLLGLAFHPQFATNGKLYVNYTTRDKHTHIVEYEVGSNPDAVDPASARELAVIKQPYSNHNGGHVEFGPDGKLYTGLGDGGAANDPQGNGQNKTTLLSKILRFDVDAPGTPKPEIVHMGLRNPWRFTFDRETGDLFIGDVGQNLWEYVHAVRGDDKRMHNFGWNVVEGSHCFDAESGTGKKTCDKSGFTLPVAEYPHQDGCSITGGVVYRGKVLPELAGRYFYADYCTGLLRSFVFAGGVVREHWNWKPAIDKKGELTQISSFGVDHDGEMYIVELTGSIYQLVPAR